MALDGEVRESGKYRGERHQGVRQVPPGYVKSTPILGAIVTHVTIGSRDSRLLLASAVTMMATFVSAGLVLEAGGVANSSVLAAGVLMTGG